MTGKWKIYFGKIEIADGATNRWICAIDPNTKAVEKILKLKRGQEISSVNADETLLAGIVERVRAAQASRAPGSTAASNIFGNPPKLAPRPTAAAISAEDLKTRLYIFADDSMQGRQTGTDGHRKGTDYIAAEAQRMGLKPAGDNGTFFQAVPVFQRALDASSTITAGATTLKAMVDFAATPGQANPKSLDGVSAIYGGVQGDTAAPLTGDQVRGRLVIFTAPADAGGRGGRGGRGEDHEAPAQIGRAHV